METLIAFLIAAAVTLYFVRGYVKKLAAPAQRSTPAPTKVRERECPRCAKKMQESSAFCPHCGAAMALWTVHSASVQKGSAAAADGKVTPVINASMCIGCASCVHACPETGTLEIVNGKAILAHPDRCTGHKKCAEACPTNAISLAVGGVLQTSRVPLLNEKFETSVPGVFIVGELSGIGLIKTAINEGKLVIDEVKRRIGTPAQHEGIHDVAIIGAGPAGLSASLAAHEAGLSYVTLEQGEIASTIRQYPRQKFLMAEPIEMPLYGRLYVADGTKEALLSVWEAIIANTGVRINTNERVGSVQSSGDGFVVKTQAREYRARFVVMALGKRGTPRKLGVEGETLPKVAYNLIEASTYKDKAILVVGGGDSAIEAALALSRAEGNRVTLCHRRSNFERARERNRTQIETAKSGGAVRVLLNSQIELIAPDHVVINTDGVVTQLPNDFVFIMVGGESPEEFLLKTGVQIVEKAIAAATFA